MFSKAFKLREFGSKHLSTSTKKKWQNILNIILKHTRKQIGNTIKNIIKNMWGNKYLKPNQYSRFQLLAPTPCPFFGPTLQEFAMFYIYLFTLLNASNKLHDCSTYNIIWGI
jgi:hypothetical protein